MLTLNNNDVGRVQARASSRPRRRVRWWLAMSGLAVGIFLYMYGNKLRLSPEVPSQGTSPSLARQLFSGEAIDSDLHTANKCGGISFQHCCQAERDSSPGVWVFLYIVLIIYIFLGIAIICDDFFVPSLEGITEKLKLSEDVAGATFMAAGSSAPELFTSVASVTTESDVGVGTIVGSAVFNILVIIALTAALSKTTLKLDWRPLTRDATYYGISICAFVIFAFDGYIQYWEAIILTILYFLYIVVMVFNQKLMGLMAKIQCGSKVASSDEEQVSNTAKQTAEITKDKVLPLGPVSDSEEATEGSDVLSPTMSHASQDGETSEIKMFKHTKRDSKASFVRRESRISENSIRRMSSFDALKLEKGGEALVQNNTAVDEPTDTQTNADADTENNEASANVPKFVQYVCFPVFDLEKPERDEEMSQALGTIHLVYQWIMYILCIPFVFMFSYTIPDCSKPKWKSWYLTSFFMSIVWIAGLTLSMVILVEKVGCILKADLLIMGLIFVAAGTSVPDALSSILVARDGFADMAVSNAIGSNVFDINLGIGLPFMIRTFIAAADGEPAQVEILSAREREAYDSALASGVTMIVPHVKFGFILLSLLFVTMIAFGAFKFTLTKGLGITFFGMYIVFITYALIQEFVCNANGYTC